MIGTSKFECSDTAASSITVYPMPESRFTALPSHMEFPQSTVDIVNETNNGIWNYSWDFGDNATSTEKDPASHTYSTWGEYLISLTSLSINCTNTTTQSIRIFPPKPKAYFSASDNGCVPWTFSFRDTSLWPTSWYWEFDDGGTSSEQHPSYTYTKPGTFNVKLTIKGEGGTDYTYRTVYVYPKPEISFAYNPALVMLPDASDSYDSKKGKVQFTNTSKFATQYLWDFGDGETSTEENPLHTYKAIGIYDVTLNVWTQNGCFDSLTKVDAVTVIVHGKVIFPNAFTPNPDGPNGGVYSKGSKDNDVFYPYWEGVTEFNMEIYDRWGEKIFESNDINIGWDGYYKGKLCKSEVYVFKAKWKYADGVKDSKVGDVTLIR